MNEATKAGSEEWRQRFENAERSGRTIAQMAGDYEVPVTTVRYWKARSARSEVPNRAKEGRSSGHPGFAKLSPIKAPRKVAEGSVEVDVGDVRLRLTRAEDVLLVVALLEALKGTRR